MFGYIKIDKYELKYRQFLEYKRYYCSVCNALRDNLGLKGCMLTSYDATLFLLIFDSLESKQEEYKLVCPLNPIKKHNMKFQISSSAMKYTAFLSAFYAFTKAKDDIIDDGNKRKHRRKLSKLEKDKRFSKLYNIDLSLLEYLNNKVDDYFEMEQNSLIDFDLISNKMGELMGSAFCGYNTISNSIFDINALYEIGFCIGKWIYIIDAYDDLQEDIKKNNFNPLLLMDDYDSLDLNKLNEKISFMSKCLTHRIYVNLDHLELHRNRDLIENIVIYGMNKSVCNIYNNKKKKYM